MELTNNYEFNKPSLENESKIKPIIENFKNIEIIVNRIINLLNNYRDQQDSILTQDDLINFKNALYEELNLIFLKEEDKLNLIKEIDKKIESYLNNTDLEGLKNLIFNDLNNYLTKDEAKNQYGLKKDFLLSQNNEKEGRKKIAQALTNKGIQTSLDSNYDILANNIKKLTTNSKNSIILKEFIKVARDDRSDYEATHTSETGGIVVFGPTELEADEARKRRVKTIHITVDDGERKTYIPAQIRSSFFYRLEISTPPSRPNTLQSMCAIHFNKKVNIQVETYEGLDELGYAIYEYQYPEQRNTNIITKEMKIITPLKQEFTFTGKGIFNPIALDVFCASTKISIYIDDNEPIINEANAIYDMKRAGIEPPEVESYGFLTKNNAHNLGVFLSSMKGFYIKNKIKIVIEELVEDESLSRYQREIDYQFTPL